MAVKRIPGISRRSKFNGVGYEGQSFLGVNPRAGGVLHAGSQESFDSFSNEQKPGCLGCIGDSTTLCYRVYYIPL